MERLSSLSNEQPGHELSHPPEDGELKLSADNRRGCPSEAEGSSALIKDWDGTRLSELCPSQTRAVCCLLCLTVLQLHTIFLIHILIPV